MDLSTWALQILSSPSLEDKLFSPSVFTDKHLQKPVLFSEPERVLSMRFQKKRKEEKLPSFHALHNADKRALCLHRFCGHELLAVEIMAQTLLLFPKAPSRFRLGLAHTITEEQGHVRLYLKRMKELGIELGDLPMYRHFWVHVPYIKTPSHYVSMMSLTFEMANLDFAPMYEKWFSFHGDEKSANLMRKILEDEIQHVAFGYRHLKNWHKENPWDSYKNSLSPFLTPKRAKGKEFQEEYRKKAGLSDFWINQLKEAL